MNRNFLPWSDQEIADLKALLDENIDVKEIAERMNRSRKAVRHKLYALRLNQSDSRTEQNLGV